MISKEIINEVRNRVHIVDVIGDYLDLKPRGEHFWALSPFKNEKTPSFCVTPSKQMYYCYSTQKGGDVFTFLMEMEGYSYPEAVEHLVKKIGLDIQQERGLLDSDRSERKALEELYTRITETFQFLLGSPVGKKALKYIQGRGISQKIIEQFRIGFAHHDPFWLHAFLLKKGYSKEFLAHAGLFSKKNSQRSLFSNRLIFPIMQHRGEVVGFGARLIEGEGPKYINSPDNSIFHKKENLYGLNFISKKSGNDKPFILCEGYIDVMAFHQAGMQNVLAPLGTAFSSSHARLMHRYTREVTIVFDGDQAGIDAAKRTAIILELEGIENRIVRLNSNQDPADILLGNGLQELQNLLSLSISALNFVLQDAGSNFDRNTPEGKAHILEEVFPYINSIISPVRREASLQIAADSVALSIYSINSAFSNYVRSSRKGRHQVIDSTKSEKTLKTDPELLLFIALLIHPEFFKRLRTHFNHNDIQGMRARLLYTVLENNYRKGHMNFFTLLEDIEDEELKKLLIKKGASSEYGDNPEEYILSAFTRVRRGWLNTRRKEIELLLHSQQVINNQKAIYDLLSEKVYIDSKLENL